MTAAPFPRAEYERRWSALRDECAARGLAGAVIVSRGGGQTDSYADVLYLANHYNVFTLLPDSAPYWSGHSHSALVLGLDGEPTLVEGFAEVREDLVVVDDVRVAADMPAGIVQVMAEKGMRGERVGLAAGNAMLAAPYRRLVELAAPGELVPFEDAVEDLRVRKTPAELERLREAAAAGEEVMRAILRRAALGGCTEADAVAEGYAVAARTGVAMYDAAVASGPFNTRYTYGRLPSWSQRTLERGDLFHIDLYGSLDGYMFDFSRSTVAGGAPTAEQAEVIEGAAAAIDAGVDALAPGRSGAELFGLVRGELVARGLADPPGDEGAEGFGGYDCHGHGYGLCWEWPWITPWDARTVEASMAIAIECMAGRPDVGLVKFEQDSIVGPAGAERLLTLPALATADVL